MESLARDGRTTANQLFPPSLETLMWNSSRPDTASTRWVSATSSSESHASRDRGQSGNDQVLPLSGENSISSGAANLAQLLSQTPVSATHGLIAGHDGLDDAQVRPPSVVCSTTRPPGGVVKPGTVATKYALTAFS